MPPNSIPSISPQALEKRCQQGQAFDIIDVRMPAEYAAVHATMARNVPLDTLHPKAVMETRTGSEDQPLYLICHSGSRSQKACEAFRQAGYDNIFSVEGGTQGWEKATLPVVRSAKQTIPLERQVRIGAGSLVLVGVGLAFFLHPVYLGLSAFVGAGLVYAGATDSCAMGMLLGKMPWNRT